MADYVQNNKQVPNVVLFLRWDKSATPKSDLSDVSAYSSHVYKNTSKFMFKCYFER